ncbi:hypothetical protein [Pseudoalteromonas sp. C8]|uniref:hypothetical protein n=1 Tax=Pseudoalteromonas sp. C8 TaxID=2686345 RepID=UPI0013FE2628|nr:hypothetical protein [Pseudoalteromonas sp. C8]
MIRQNKCLELGLPEPHPCQKEANYVLSVIALGIKADTNMATSIGIDSLQSVASALERKGYVFTLGYEDIKCPLTGRLARRSANLSMTKEQQELFKNEESRKES